jgi:cell division cycle 20-like protein 1 (cofactor of APC complex)
VLDALDLQDDFYLNLIDWSSQNVMSVGLGCCIYLWPVSTSDVMRLCDLSGDRDSVTSVAWNELVSHNSASLFLCKAVNCYLC